ncbi:MAG TPA: glycosyltransferase [Rubricoccaceae bacterium]
MYVQYANPAAYPPVMHGARILADAGWDVRMLGVEMDGTETLREKPHPNVSVRRLPLAPVGWQRRAQYARFAASALREIALRRPTWVYASDLFSTPIALAAQRLGLTRVLYHEHDAPGAVETRLSRAVLPARQALARSADLCVIPNAARAAAFVRETGRSGSVECVWNCPSLQEVISPRAPFGDALTVYYHGSLNETRLPMALLDALSRVPASLTLRVVGYETIGSRGFTTRFLDYARRVGVADRVHVDGPLDRAAVMEACGTAHVGLALMPLESPDLNMSAMAGASNKPFDYASNGLALVVTDLPDWRSLFVDAGCALAVDPADPASLAAVFGQLASDPTRVRRMGEAGRARVASEWNYEAQFAPVLAVLSAPGRA